MIELKTIEQLEKFWLEQTKAGNTPDIKFCSYNYTGKIEWQVSIFRSADGCSVTANESGPDLEEIFNKAMVKFERTKAQGLVTLSKPIDGTFEEVPAVGQGEASETSDDVDIPF